MRVYKLNPSSVIITNERSATIASLGKCLHAYPKEFHFDDSSLVVSSLHLFKRGSSCRAVVGRRNRKTLFARESPHSFCLRRGRSAACARHPHTTPSLIKARTVIARKIYDEKGKDTESP